MATATNVSVGKPKVAGAIYVAPAGTALPTDASTTLAETFVSLGYISDAGVVNGENNETTSVKAWGGDTVLSALTGREDTWKMTFIEALNLDLLKEIFICGSVNNVNFHRLNGNCKLTVSINAISLNITYADIWRPDKRLSVLCNKPFTDLYIFLCKQIKYNFVQRHNISLRLHQ